jgi:hypothetical protein
MTDHVARAIEREFSQHLDTCDLYDLKARVEVLMRPYRDKVNAKRFARPLDEISFTPEELKRINELAGATAGWMGERFSA